MPTFLTVKDAARLTGKSPSSIRRIIYPIINDDAHADRTQIRPSVEEALKLRTRGENFPWRLSEELLLREVPMAPPPGKGSDDASGPVLHAESELLAMLRRELDIKNQQITQQHELFAKQMELITGLGERLREGNILIASLQQRLALTDGRTTTTPETDKPKRGASARPEKGSSIASKPPKPRKSFLARFFGRSS
jgi:hypothetical protein